MSNRDQAEQPKPLGPFFYRGNEHPCSSISIPQNDTVELSIRTDYSDIDTLYTIDLLLKYTTLHSEPSPSTSRPKDRVPMTKSYLIEASFADLIRTVETHPELKPQTRTHWCCSLRQIAQALEKPLEFIPARWVAVWPQIKLLHHARVGSTPKTLANHKANVRAALLWFAEGAGAAKVGVPLTEEWGALRASIPEEHHRKVLSSSIRYWSARGLTPRDVDEAALDTYMRYRGETTRLVVSDATRRHIARAWNASIGVVQGWPKHRLIEPPVRTLASPAWEEFPQGLRGDIESYLAGLRKIRRGVSEKRIRPCKPVTIRTRFAELQAFARMAARQGFPISSLDSLAALLEPDLVQKVIDAYWRAEDEKPRIYVINLGWKLHSIARETACLREDQLARLDELRVTLETHRRGGMTEKNLAVIRQVLTNTVWDEVLNLPAALMEEARMVRHQAPVKASVTAQMAAAIAILSVAPVRLKNLVNIKIGFNLIKPGGLHSPHWLVFPDYDVKNRVKLEFPFDQELSDLLCEYIHDFRPTLLRGSKEDWLFPGQTRAIKFSRLLSLQITRRILKATGLRITVHQFRHAAGAVFLKENPGEYVLVQLLLGHTSVQTTIKFYIGLASTQASELFGKLIRKRINKDGQDDN